MKRRVLLNLWHALNKLEGQKHDVRFSYFLAKNKVALKTEIEALDEAQKPNAAFIEFENKRIDLAKKYSDKDVTGNPKIHNGQYVIFDQKDEFDEEIKNLREKFKAAIESREAQVEGRPFSFDMVKKEEIKIGDNVWIGWNCTVLKGVQIGENSVVAAGSVVLRGKYPNNSLIAGNPAKVVKVLD